MKSFKVANFRLFDKEGVKVDFKPITILTGANSSGKSSFVKAMVLMKNYLATVDERASDKPASVQLDFSSPELKLSGFKDTLNDKCPEGDGMTFTIATASRLAPFRGMEAEYSFKPSRFSDSKGELDRIRLLFEGKPFFELNVENGHSRRGAYDYKGFLLEAFLFFAKGILFDQASKTYDKGEHGALASATIDGVDVMGWDKCFNPNTVPLDTEISKRLISYFRVRSVENLHLTEAIRKYDDTGILFYFPLFDDILKDPEKYSKETVLDILDSVEGYEELKGRVVERFRKAGEASFVDYYKRLEDADLRELEIEDDSDSNLLGGDLIFVIELGWKYKYHRWDDYQGSEFQDVLRLMHALHNQRNSKSDPFIARDHYNGETHTEHKILKAYNRYLVLAVLRLMSPKSLDMMEVAGNSFTPVQRLYSFDDKSSFAETIKRFQALSRTIVQNQLTRQKKKEWEKEEQDFREGRTLSLSAERFLSSSGTGGLVEYVPGSFVNKWLNELDIALGLVIDDNTDGLGFKLYLEKSGGRHINLADEGHGVTQLVSILLHIECIVMQSKIDHASGYTRDVKDWDVMSGNTSCLAIEEPEVSLHPAMQSKLALMFQEANELGVNFIVETHSEYMVRKTQVIVSSMKDKSKNPFAVYYFTRDGKAYELGYDESGAFNRQFGTGFLDEARNLAMAVFLGESNTIV